MELKDWSATVSVAISPIGDKFSVIFALAALIATETVALQSVNDNFARFLKK